MNKKLEKLVKELNEKSGKNYKLDLYLTGYGLSLDHVMLAETIKGITAYIKDAINR